MAVSFLYLQNYFSITIEGFGIKESEVVGYYEKVIERHIRKGAWRKQGLIFSKEGVFILERGVMILYHL